MKNFVNVLLTAAFLYALIFTSAYAAKNNAAYSTDTTGSKVLSSVTEKTFPGFGFAPFGWNISDFVGALVKTQKTEIKIENPKKKKSDLKSISKNLFDSPEKTDKSEDISFGDVEMDTKLDKLECWISTFNNGLSSEENRKIGKWVIQYSIDNGYDWRWAAALFAAESAYKPYAQSYVGAAGLGQLMPETAAELGVGNPWDTKQNIDGAIRYMSGLYQMWDGYPNRMERTLASYNAGPGAVENYDGVPPYHETINYVKTIQGYYRELVTDDETCYFDIGIGEGSCPVPGHHHTDTAFDSAE